MQDILYRVRNSLSLASISTIATGVGMALIGLFVPLGWPNMSAPLARTLTYVGLGLVLLGILFAILKNSKNPIEKTKRVYGIISILANMEKRLWILAGNQDPININWQEYIKTSTKINQLLGVSAPNVFTVEEAQKEVASLENDLKERVFVKNELISKKVELVRSISRLLDKDDFGLKKERESNKYYLQLNRLADKYYDDYKDVLDNEIDDLIKSHRDVAIAGANVSLVKKRILYLVKLTNAEEVFSPSVQSDLEGLETDVKDWLVKVRIKISQHITTISSKKT